MRSRTLDLTNRSFNKSYDALKSDEKELGKNEQYNSLKTLENRMKIIEDEKMTNTPPVVRRSHSQNTKLRPIP